MAESEQEFYEGRKRLQELVETNEEKWEFRFAAKTFVFWEMLDILEFWCSRVKEAVRRYRSFRLELSYDPDESSVHLRIYPETDKMFCLNPSTENAHSIYETVQMEDHMVSGEAFWYTTIFMEIVLKKVAELLNKHEAFRVHLLYDAENLNVRGVLSRPINPGESRNSFSEDSIP